MSAIPQRRSRTQEYELEEDDAYYVTRQPTSAVRYPQPRQQVIQRGNKRIVIHNEPPPTRRLHWSFILGVGMILMLALWVLGSYALSWWQNHQLDSTYGMPRTYQTDQVVGHADSTEHPTHCIAINLNAHITIIEIPGGNNVHARIYSGPTLYSDNGDQTPVTLEFYDVNDGTQFKPQQ
jgi:hypothetical protein